MTIGRIRIECDTPGCWAYCEMSANDIARAREKAADRYDWSTVDGRDYCGPCTRPTTEEGNR